MLVSDEQSKQLKEFTTKLQTRDVDEEKLASVWLQLATHVNPLPVDTWMDILTFTLRSLKSSESSLRVKKYVLHFLSRNLNSRIILNEQLWVKIINIISVLVDHFDLSDNASDLNIAVQTFQSIFVEVLILEGCDDMLLLIYKVMKSNPKFFVTEVRIQFVEILIVHLRLYSRIGCEKRFLISTDIFVDLLESQPSLFSLEKLKDVICLIEESCTHEATVLAVLFITKIIRTDTWGFIALRLYNASLKQKSVGTVKAPMIELYCSIIDDNLFSLKASSMICDTLLCLMERLDLGNRTIDQSAVRVILKLMSSGERDFSDCYQILAICLRRESTSANKVISEFMPNVELFFAKQINLMRNSSSELNILNLTETVDKGLYVVSLQFLVQSFDFLFLCNRIVDCKWLNRLAIYIERFQEPVIKTELDRLNKLFGHMSQLINSKTARLNRDDLGRVFSQLVSKVQWERLLDEHATLVLTLYFDVCESFSHESKEILMSFEKNLSDSDFRGSSFEKKFFMTTYLQRTLALSEVIVADCLQGHDKFCQMMLLFDALIRFGNALIDFGELNFWSPELYVNLTQFLTQKEVLQLHLLVSESSNCVLTFKIESLLTVGLKILFCCFRDQKDWKIFESVVKSVPPFLQHQEIVEQVFQQKVVESCLIESSEDTIISLGRTYLEQLVISLCSLAELTTTGFKLRFFPNAENYSMYVDSFGSYRSSVFQCLICLVTFPLGVKSRRIIDCFANAIQDSKYGVSCLCALSACFLECPQLCIRSVPIILSNIFKVKSSRTMSVPALDLIFMLSQVPTLQHNLNTEDHKQILSVILQFVDYETYSKYCVEVALNLICVWFLKCRVAYRVQLKKLILRELQNRIAGIQQRLNHANHSKTAAKTTGNENNRHNLANQETSRDSFEATEKITTKSDTNSSLSEILNWQLDALEVCMDVIIKHVFCETLSQPKRCEISKFLLENGQSKTWIVNNRVVTITTSGNISKLQENGLCSECNERASENLKEEPKPKTDRQRHKSTPQTPHGKKPTENSTCIESKRQRLPSFLNAIEEVKHCSCWISRWAEVYVRTPTGNLSYLFRTQSQGGMVPLVSSDFGLENLTSLLSSVSTNGSDGKDIGVISSCDGSTELGELTDSAELESISDGSTFVIPSFIARQSILGAAWKRRVSFDFSNLLRSRSLDDLTADDMNNGNKALTSLQQSQTQSRRESKETLVKKRHASSAVTTGPLVIRPRQRTLTKGPNTETKSSNFDFSNPATVFYQLFGTLVQQPSERSKIRDGFEKKEFNPIFCLPENEDAKEEINYLDNWLPFNTHKVGVLYVDEDQEQDERAVLSNICGSDRYTDFIRGLGSVLFLSECNKEQKIYNAALDKSIQERDGKLAICWIEELFQIMFHVSTLMPTPDPQDDADCNRKKALIGNDAVLIIYNDSKTPRLTQPIIKTELNFVSIVVTPTDSKRNCVKLICKSELEPWVLHSSREEKIVSDCNLAMYVRQMALHASMACHGYLFKQKNLDYTSNWQKRLDIIRKMKSNFAVPDDVLQ